MTNVETLIEALPYIREFRGETFVIRCASQLSESDRSALCRDVAMLRFVGVKAVIVHPHEEPVADGGRAAANHRLVHALGTYGKATGLAGSDGAPRWLLSVAETGDLAVNVDLLMHVIDDYTPVVEAVAVDPTGAAVPADPDDAAARLAVELGAHKVLFVIGDHRVTIEEGEERGEVSEMRATEDVASLVEVGPELEAAFRAGLYAVQSGRVRFAHLIPTEFQHGLLVELFTDGGYGTKIRSGEDWAEEADFPSRGYWCWPPR